VIVTTAEAGREIYLDNNATTTVLPEVLRVLIGMHSNGPLNPSSVHGVGDRARRHLEKTRDSLSTLLGASAHQIVFTSGATEANHIVLRSLLVEPFQRFRFITTAVEHSSILQAAQDLERQGCDVRVLPVDGFGLPDLDEVEALIVPGRTLVSLQWANNETGVIQPLAEVVGLVKAQDGLVHTDATQAVGKVPVNVSQVPVDFLSLSAHKFHGPVGAGALFLRDPKSIQPSLRGGGQEGGLRPGTENVPALVAMGVAADLRRARLFEGMAVVAALRDDFERRLGERSLLEAINGEGVERLPNTSNVRFSGVDGEALVLRLDKAGIRCSQSSACTNRKPEPSYVLRAMGLTEDQAYRSIRFSLSDLTTREEIHRAVETIAELHTELAPFHALTLQA
jgi:cysteine desulfurase